ncbi:lysis system i-spanin subunit Rz [Pseudomonas aeruginosa]|uniref:lysis system i-spanin subunit Rz n=1 Tax=Pseudomonas aeruginosa TaxID=287 RepID=UPI0004F2F9B5|nr:lysis system i-spanin subunit Rz [Pseudomonas aeruginosa]KSH43792.1 lysis protein [Pseudomonas aeruginosa]MBA4984524.1 lysis protein [Pseudomonas aeruginosa]MDW0131212.1 lysis system i-spanin subunit Rz [Pseudomonas aeruginosa]HBO0000279.1 lysis protein [Pseudomonas aeruginosa]HBO0059966.1 lysis protein [Pseudomonas aeruginosa]
MTWRPWLVVALVGALVFWRLDHVTAQRDDLQAAVEQSAETITAMAQQAQRDAQAQVQADALARTYQAALQASHEENQLRRDAIGTGARVVYVKARCPAGGVHQAPGATGSADAGRALLAAADGQVVSDLRAGVERRELMIKALREHVAGLQKLCRRI